MAIEKILIPIMLFSVLVHVPIDLFFFKITSNLYRNKDKCETGCERYTKLIEYYPNNTFIAEYCDVDYSWQKKTRDINEICLKAGDDICTSRGHYCSFEKYGKKKTFGGEHEHNCNRRSCDCPPCPLGPCPCGDDDCYDDFYYAFECDYQKYTAYFFSVIFTVAVILPDFFKIFLSFGMFLKSKKDREDIFGAYMILTEIEFIADMSELFGIYFSARKDMPGDYNNILYLFFGFIVISILIFVIAVKTKVIRLIDKELHSIV